MKIINPSVELVPYDGDAISMVARCARVCYGKFGEKRKEDADLFKNLLNLGHNSMFRHATYYAIAPKDFSLDTHSERAELIGIGVGHDNKNVYVAWNGNFAIDYPEAHEELMKYSVSPEEFGNSNPMARELMRYTFKVVTQISTSRELNRQSPNSIAEKSTRYVKFDEGEIVRPHWMDEEVMEAFNKVGRWCDEVLSLSKVTIADSVINYLDGVDYAFWRYQRAIESGMSKQDARGILPLDTATTVIYTNSVRDWRHVIELRTGHRAHPNCQIIAGMIKDELIKLGYTF